MKSSYQRNMWIGQLVAALVVVVPVWVFCSLSTAPESTPQTTVTNVHVDQEAKTTLNIPPTRRNVVGRARADNNFHGQWLEPGQLKIIPDNPVAPMPVKEPPKVFAVEPMPSEIEGDISVSDLDTGDFGSYIPGDADYVFELDDQPKVDSIPPPISRGAELVYSVKAPVPPIAEEMGIGDSVKVLLLIGPDGRHANYAVHEIDTEETSPEFYLDVVGSNGIKKTLEFYIDPVENDLRYVTLREGDRTLKFAEYFYKVLPQWQFRPALKDGVPVYSFVHITYRFCAPKDSECEAITVSLSS